MIILLHSSKTMRASKVAHKSAHAPQLIDQAVRLDAYLKTLSPDQLATSMHLSQPMAKKTHALIAGWDPRSQYQLPALDSFIGDIYSGLQVEELTDSDRLYAEDTLRILSGLYGVLRPLDHISPYRLELGYRFPKEPFKNLYNYWGKSIADTLEPEGLVVNVSSAEYTKSVLPYIDQSRVVTPKFLTVDAKTSEPVFVTVHAKIARGAFARWLIKTRTSRASDLKNFDYIGYKYSAKLSTPQEPVFVAQEFGGLGLSVRLT